MKNKFVYGLLIITFLVVLVEIIYFFSLNNNPLNNNIINKIPFISRSFQQTDDEYITLLEIANYSSPNSNDVDGKFTVRRYFKIIGQQGDWLKVKTTRYESSWEGWIKKDSKAYQLVNK